MEPSKLAAYGLSDTGLVRKNNEDMWSCAPELGLYVLADGMGGHQAGEVAARETTFFFLSHMKHLLEEEKGIETAEEAAELIRLGIEETNHFVHQLSKTHELLVGMGTTFVCLFFYRDSVIYGHVGDSRIYLQHKEGLEQLTFDHSLLRELLERGCLSEKQVDDSYKNIITRAIGTEPFVEPTVKIARVSSGDLYLLCSDGLSDLLSNEEIGQVLRLPLTVEEKVRTLIALAKRKGGHDNVTAVLVEVKV
ncbi:MAG: serine/threonine-protein phosphatase [Verrucomicrobia bacterium]|nr:serine/threonine-protein phosphatase [Verrucomicrobiota bacterium]